MTPDGTGIALHSITACTVVYFLGIFTLAVLVAAHLAEALARFVRIRAGRRRCSAPAPPDLRTGRGELAGSVETDPHGKEAIRVSLRQQAFDGGSGRSRWTDWKEQERTVEVRPFTLVLHGTGARIPVIPGERPRLLARATLAPTGPRERVLTAVLRHGDRARIDGVLAPAPDGASGYRDAPHGFVLQAPAGMPMRVEAESAARQTDLSADASRWVVSMINLGCAALVALAAVWHTSMLLESTTVLATVSSTRTCWSTYKGKTTGYPCYDARAPDLPVFEGIRGEPTVGRRVLVSFARDTPSNFTPGDTLDPSKLVTFVIAIGSMMLWLFGSVRYLGCRDLKRWYDVEPYDTQEPA